MTVNINEEDIKKANKNTIKEYEDNLDQLEKDIDDKNQNLYEKQELKKFQDDNKDKVNILAKKIISFNSSKFYDLEIKDFVTPEELDGLEFKNIDNFKERLKNSETDLQVNEDKVKTKLKEDINTINKNIDEKSKSINPFTDKPEICLVGKAEVPTEANIDSCDCSVDYTKLTEYYCLIEQENELLALQLQKVESYLNEKLAKFKDIVEFITGKSGKEDIKNQYETIHKKIEELNKKGEIKIEEEEDIKDIFDKLKTLNVAINNSLYTINNEYGNIKSKVEGNYKNLKIKIDNFIDIDKSTDIKNYLDNDSYKNINKEISIGSTLSEYKKTEEYYQNLYDIYKNNVISLKKEINKEIQFLIETYTNINVTDSKGGNENIEFFGYETFESSIEDFKKDENINNDANKDEYKIEKYKNLIISIITEINKKIDGLVQKINELKERKKNILDEEINKYLEEFCIKAPLFTEYEKSIKPTVVAYKHNYIFKNVKYERESVDIKKDITDAHSYLINQEKAVKDYVKEIFKLFLKVFNDINNIFNIKSCRVYYENGEIKYNDVEIYDIIDDSGIKTSKFLERVKELKELEELKKEEAQNMIIYEKINTDFYNEKIDIDFLKKLIEAVKYVFDHNLKILKDAYEKGEKYITGFPKKAVKHILTKSEVFHKSKDFFLKINKLNDFCNYRNTEEFKPEEILLNCLFDVNLDDVLKKPFDFYCDIEDKFPTLKQILLKDEGKDYIRYNTKYCICLRSVDLLDDLIAINSYLGDYKKIKEQSTKETVLKLIENVFKDNQDVFMKYGIFSESVYKQKDYNKRMKEMIKCYGNGNNIFLTSDKEGSFALYYLDYGLAAYSKLKAALDKEKINYKEKDASTKV